jgi:hypothetical protein
MLDVVGTAYCWLPVLSNDIFLFENDFFSSSAAMATTTRMLHFKCSVNDAAQEPQARQDRRGALSSGMRPISELSRISRRAGGGM